MPDERPSDPSPVPGLGHSASIPVAYITLVIECASENARGLCGFFGKEIVPSGRVTGASLSDVMATEQIYEEALEAIANGADPWDTSADALDRAEKQRIADCPPRRALGAP